MDSPFDVTSFLWRDVMDKLIAGHTGGQKPDLTQTFPTLASINLDEKKWGSNSYTFPFHYGCLSKRGMESLSLDAYYKFTPKIPDKLYVNHRNQEYI